MLHLLYFSAGDALNIFLYLLQNNSFKVRNLMRWVFFSKLCIVTHLVVAQDDRLLELALAFVLTTTGAYITACTIRAIIARREELKAAKIETADIYILMFLDLGF